MKDGYCDNCLNPAECYLSGRCWPVVDHHPDAGNLCAEMDESFVDYKARLRCEECNVELPAKQEKNPHMTAAKAKNAGVWVKNFIIHGDESGYHYFCCADHGKAWRKKNIPCPYCNGWGIEPNDEFSPCRAGCEKAPELDQIDGIIKDVTVELFSSENA